jgi:hypothetical protein
LIEPSPFTALIARAARLYARRVPLYIACAIGAFALQIGIELTHMLDPRLLDLVGQIVVLPMLAAIVYGFVAHDATEDGSPDVSVWERIAERAWAVIVIDAITTIFSFAAPGSDFLLGLVYFTGDLILAAFLMYADVGSVVQPGLSTRAIVPQSILASARIAMTRIGYGRAIVMVFLQLLISYTALVIDAAIGTRVLGISTFGSAGVLSLLAGPVAALLTVIYLELRQPPAK